MDRKKSRLGLGTEIAESKVEESGIVASKIMTYPLIFTPPPIKLIKYVFEQCIACLFLDFTATTTSTRE